MTRGPKKDPSSGRSKAAQQRKMIAAFKQVEKTVGPQDVPLIQDMTPAIEEVAEIMAASQKKKDEIAELATARNDVEKYRTSLVMYLKGVSVKEIAKKLDINTWTVDRWLKMDAWEALRTDMFRTVREEAAKSVKKKEVDKAKKMVDVLDPLLLDLTEKAVMHSETLDGIAGKDYVRLALDAMKLKAQLSGEFVENKAVSVGPNEAFQKIMEMNMSEPPMDLDPEFVRELKKEPKLIE